jgi:hypothetical protein
MWALLIGVLAAGGLVKYTYGQKEEPTLKPALRKAKLIRLGRKKLDRLTLNEAEDGSVLAREFNSPGLEKRFKVVAARLKKARSKGTPR